MKKANVRILPAIYVIVTIMVAGLLLWLNSRVAVQSGSVMYPKIYFQGEYKIGDGQWQEYRPGVHISANKGDITLKGTLHKYFPSLGEEVGYVEPEQMVAFYCDHLRVSIQEKNFEPIFLEVENPNYEFYCAKIWEYYCFQGGSDQETVISIHNPHKFGNENAVDEMLNNMYSYIGYEFEEDREKFE